jgi:hypothetical protein
LGPPSWFDRPDWSTSADAPAATPTPVSGAGWPWSGGDTATPGATPDATITPDDTAAPNEPAAPDDTAAPDATVTPASATPANHEDPASATPADDEDDDWPSRYSWLDDEPDGPDGSGAPGSAQVMGEKSAPGENGETLDENPDERAAAARLSLVPAEATRPVGALGDTKTPKTPKAAANGLDGAAEGKNEDDEGDDEVVPQSPTLLTAPILSSAPSSNPAPAPSSNPAPAPSSNPSPSPSPTPTSAPSRTSASTPEAESKAEVPAGLSLVADHAAEAEHEAEDEDEDEDVLATGEAGAALDPSLVAVIRGVPRYHKPDCVLIRFMPEGDSQKLSVAEAKKAGCTPCTACEPQE